MDENISRYRIGMRGKKQRWCIFTWLVDVSIHNAWQLHKKSGGLATQLEFRRDIVTTYLKRYGVQPRSPGEPRTYGSLSSRVLETIRYEHVDHYVVQTDEKKKKRCASEGCKSIIRTMCKKCSVGLCIPYSLLFTLEFKIVEFYVQVVRYKRLVLPNGNNRFICYFQYNKLFFDKIIFI